MLLLVAICRRLSGKSTPKLALAAQRQQLQAECNATVETALAAQMQQMQIQHMQMLQQMQQQMQQQVQQQMQQQAFHRKWLPLSSEEATDDAAPAAEQGPAVE